MAKKQSPNTVRVYKLEYEFQRGIGKEWNQGASIIVAPDLKTALKRFFCTKLSVHWTGWRLKKHSMRYETLS